MKRALCIFFAAVFATAFIRTAVFCQTTDDHKIIAVVNDDVITEADLDTALSSVRDELKKEYSGPELDRKLEEARNELLNQMIDDKLILQEAKKKGVIVGDSEIDERFKEVKSRFPSEDIFYSEVQKAGITTEVLKNRYRENIMMGKLVTHEVKDKVVVTPAEIEKYYEQHREELKAPESVKLRGIMLRFDDKNTPESVKQKAEDIIKLAGEGRDFGELAKLYSQDSKASEGGEFGTVERGQLRGEFDKVIFNLKPGGISEPIKTDTGYFIFKIDEKSESHVRPLAEAREDIEDIIFREKAQKRYQDWIAKLKRDAFIQIK